MSPTPEGYPAISDYAFVSDCRSCGLVSSDGSIDWLCFRRFDTNPVFARLLDRSKGGYFRIAPRKPAKVSRRYIPDTLVVETRFETDKGVLTVTDCLPVWDDERNPGRLARPEPRDLLVRLVKCEAGEVEVDLEFHPRFDFGLTTPLFYLVGEDTAHVIGGSEALRLQCGLGEMEPDGQGGCAVHARLRQGEVREVAVSWVAPHLLQPLHLNTEDLRTHVERTMDYWRRWAARCTYAGPRRDVVVRSLLTLKGLTCDETGAIIAAATTSLPEEIGGVRNWDYRFSWLRDSVMLLAALGSCGYVQEAREFGAFLLRTTAGRADELQILYGLGGERLLAESDLNFVEGYRGSKPVRVGNGAYDQFQMDTYGELMGVTSFLLQRILGGKQLGLGSGIELSPEQIYWLRFMHEVADTAARRWQEPDDGIWESRGGRQHFTFSKLMAWLSLDRAIALFSRLPGTQARLPEWRAARDAIREAIETKGVDPKTGAFTQYFGSSTLDAATLQVLLTGFLPPEDPRVQATLEHIDKELTSKGLVYRYLDRKDGLPGGEGTFTFCTLWLVTALAMAGQVDRAEQRLEEVLSYANDVGLLAEEIDPSTGEQLGNMPQAFSHVGLIQAIFAIEQARQKKGAQRPLGYDVPSAEALGESAPPRA
ncbi:glycoside hydrolase family 15 protein [Myxococcaceae bacterium GXIMD 01537]